jgi:hypothetical protein
MKPLAYAAAKESLLTDESNFENLYLSLNSLILFIILQIDPLIAERGLDVLFSSKDAKFLERIFYSLQ